jgi:putative ABC transport system ATP-binding protein
MNFASEPIVTISNLNYKFGSGTLQRQVLYDINLQIHAGEIVIMSGPSGSGKTTLLTLIGALRSAQEGSLYVLGRELNGTKEQQFVQVRTQIGYIFQSHNLLGFLTALQNVQMPMDLHPEVPQAVARRLAITALEAVGLGTYLHAYPQNLSGGQKQRVAIARALVSKPQLILADEPTASLDGRTGRDIVDLLQALAREQRCAILLVTHDHRILDIADRLISLEDGRLLTE